MIYLEKLKVSRVAWIETRFENDHPTDDRVQNE